MMIRFVLSAEVELLDIRDWYENRQAGLGIEFLNEISVRLNMIENAPNRFPPEETNPSTRDVRRCVLKKFPHRIIYEITTNRLQVLAIAHGSRKPHYWVSRFEEE